MYRFRTICPEERFPPHMGLAINVIAFFLLITAYAVGAEDL